MTDNELRLTCTGCGDYREDTERRYGFGYYAGLLCSDCRKTYRDHCGIDGSQGNPTDLDEFAYGGMTAIEGCMKTLAGWRQAKVNLSDYIYPGDEIDEELFDYCLGAVPPAYRGHGLMLMGEPVDHAYTPNMIPLYPLYDAFQYTPTTYHFLGVMSIDEAKDTGVNALDYVYGSQAEVKRIAEAVG